MAMASMATTLSASRSLASSGGLLSKPAAISRRSPASLPVVVSALDGSQANGAALSRRQVAVSLTALSVALFASSQRQAQARDIPIFGLKKAKKITEEVCVYVFRGMFSFSVVLVFVAGVAFGMVFSLAVSNSAWIA
jgi:hypothetical protein